MIAATPRMHGRSLVLDVRRGWSSRLLSTTSPECIVTLSKRIHHCMSSVVPRSEEQEATRQFWKSWYTRFSKHSPGLRDRHRDMWRCVFQRTAPLKRAGLHAAYSTVLTLPFIHAPLWFDWGLGTCWNPYADMFLQAWFLEHSGCMYGTTILATPLFLLLSFRVNRAAHRWWDGRVLYGEMMAEANSEGQYR